MPPTTLPPATPAAHEAVGPWLVAVPHGWPPYDCETHGAACPAARETGEGAVAGPGEAPAGARRAAASVRPRAGGASPGTGTTAAWPRQLAQVIVEILGGSRPSRQLIPWTTDHVRARVADLARLLAAGQRPALQRVVTSRPSASVMEMTMVVSTGPRSRALALRFEHVPERPAAPGRPLRPARWLCTEIETG